MEAQEQQDKNNSPDFSEIVIALVSAVGTDLQRFTTMIIEELELYEFKADVIRVSQDILGVLDEKPAKASNIQTIEHYMGAGNRYRAGTNENAALAYSAIAKISELRCSKLNGAAPQPLRKQAWIIRSLKHPDEVAALRETYGDSLFVLGIHTSYQNRFLNLKKKLKKAEDENLIHKLIARDADEGSDSGHGQHTRDTFHLSDFFIDEDQNLNKNKADIERVFKLIFGEPFLTPTFDEYAMYMAFSASTRSADLSRQVGAVLAKDKNIISTGANDVPKPHGGLYWPELVNSEIVDLPNGRDHTLGYDANKKTIKEIVDDLITKLGLEDNEVTRSKFSKTKLNDITEYGRVVHAEMEAILSCGRSANSTVGTSLYCTTFPCHNCAKHIIAAGVKRVVYVEPYSKSKAFEFHGDSISDGRSEDKVSFEPFVGVGPRSFLNLFSMKLGNGRPIKRKNSLGETVEWSRESATLRMTQDWLRLIAREEFATAYAAEQLTKYKTWKLQNEKE